MQCKASFTTYKQLQMHKRNVKMNGHKQYDLVHIDSLVITNQRPFCESAFALRESAINHVKASLQHGRFAVDRAYLRSKVQEPGTMLCNMCSCRLTDLTVYHSHVIHHVQAVPIVRVLPTNASESAPGFLLETVGLMAQSSHH